MTQDIEYGLPPRKPVPGPRTWVTVMLAVVLGLAAGFIIPPLVGSGQGGNGASVPSARGGLLDHAELSALAETLERNQLYAEAARAWEQAAELNPPAGADKAERLFRIGKNLSLAGEHERAIRYLLAAEAADTESKWKASINKLVLEGLSALGKEDARAQEAARRVSLAAGGEGNAKPIAEIGGEPITQTDLDTFARRMVFDQVAMQRRFMAPEAYEEAVDAQLERFRTPEGRQQLLQAYLSQELLYREALAAGVPGRDDVRQQILDARRAILTTGFMDDYLGRNLQVAETDIRNAYEANKSQYVEPEAVKVEAIVVDSDDVKARVSAALDEGQAFAEVRDALSTVEPSADRPDPFDTWITRDGHVPLAAESKTALAHVLSLDEGETGSKWIEGTGGRSLRFRLAERRPERQLSLDESRDRVAAGLRASRQRELIEHLQEQLRRKYKVVVHEPASEGDAKGGS